MKTPKWLHPNRKSVEVPPTKNNTPSTPASPSPKSLQTTPGRKLDVDFFPPMKGGGTMLDASAGLGEPLNVIISGKSSPEVLTDDGLLNWARSIGFSHEFLGLHSGTPQTANLGDGNGALPEVKVIRQNFFLPIIGSGIESLIGGNHFRYWRQNGPRANTGALFLAVSQEENVFQHHNIIPNGYDLGRDELVAKAEGTTSFLGVRYSTTVKKLEGLLAVGATGINHNIPIDGNVYLLTITIDKPPRFSFLRR